MTDDIYEHIRFDGQPHAAPAGRRARAARAHAGGQRRLQDLRDDRLAHRLGGRARATWSQALDTLLSQSTGNCCSISQAAAAAALNGDQSFVAESVASTSSGATARWRASTRFPGLSCRDARRRLLPLHQLRRPDRQDHARRARRSNEDGDVVMYLLESVGVAVVAGTAYGLSPYFRLSIATSHRDRWTKAARASPAPSPSCADANAPQGHHACTYKAIRKNPSAPQVDAEDPRRAARDPGRRAERQHAPQHRHARACTPTTARSPDHGRHGRHGTLARRRQPDLPARARVLPPRRRAGDRCRRRPQQRGGRRHPVLLRRAHRRRRRGDRRRDPRRGRDPGARVPGLCARRHPSRPVQGRPGRDQRADLGRRHGGQPRRHRRRRPGRPAGLRARRGRAADREGARRTWRPKRRRCGR